jgi:hypothetical protein
MLFFPQTRLKKFASMNDILVLSSFEALRHEKLRLDRSEAELNDKLRLRGVLLKLEEVANRRQLTNLLVRVQMLQCESTCLGVLVKDDREEIALTEKRYASAMVESRRAANDRKEYNTYLACEIRRLSGACRLDESARAQSLCTFPVFMSDAEKFDAVVQNYAELALVRTAVESSTARHEEMLRRLEDTARDGREKHMAAATDLSRTCCDLKAHIIKQRLELRQLYSPEDASRLICWAETVSSNARAKARWDFMHPVCMLDVVMLEGLRLRVLEEEEERAH